MMKMYTRPAKVEWATFLLLMPLIGVLVNYLLFGTAVFSRIDAWLFSYPVILFQGLVSWYLHICVMHWLRKQFPDIKQTVIRLSILLVAHISLITFTYISLFTFYDATAFLNYQLDTRMLRIAVFIGIAITVTITSIWETDYVLKQWKTTAAEKERLEQLTLQHEFDTLKGQVNPHFLFNCFNTLSSLITEDKKQAEDFLNQLSKVYRYLLSNNQDGLSSLDTEIKFIESYYQLLKTRHGESLKINIEIDKQYASYLLPTLSLQMLVENAVKHNILSKTVPLEIDIFTTPGNLVVSNNLQLRTIKAPSNKVGLKNISQKYELLKETGFHVFEDQKTFTVVLPLIWNTSSLNLKYSKPKLKLNT